MRLAVVLLLLVGYAAAANLPWTKIASKTPTAAATKRPSVKLANAGKCPDGESYCADGQTCCKIASGGYGCCPYQNATFCSDGEHCCPNGHSCELKSGACVNGANGESLSLQKLPTRSYGYCPDYTYCPSGDSCCKLYTGGYGCCPYSKAVCCSDGEHCCPYPSYNYCYDGYCYQ